MGRRWGNLWAMVGGPTFSCPRCARQFPWHAEYAGRKMRCGCGHVFIPAPPAGGGGDDYALAPEPVEHAAPSPPQAAATMPPVARHAPRMEQEEDTYSPFRHFYLPIALLAVGGALWIGQATVAPLRDSFLVSIGLVLVMAIVSVAIMLGGAYICAAMLSVNFGAVRSAVLKFAAAAVFAGAIAMAIARMSPNDMRALVVAWHAMVILYWFCFYMFFELDLQETLMSVAVIGLMQAGGLCILWRP